MTDTGEKSPLWRARETEGLSREAVVRQLEPPVTTKTLERWEKDITPCPRYRLRELARIYRTKLADLQEAA